MITINITTNADISALETQVAEVKSELEALREDVRIEKAQVDAKLADLEAKVAEGTASKEETLSLIREIRGEVKGIIPDPPAEEPGTVE